MSDNLLDLRISQCNLSHPVYCLSVQGELDINTSPKLKQALDLAIGAGSTQLLLNLDGVGYIDSTGLAVLVASRKRLQESHGGISIVCSNRHILKLFDMTGLVQLFSIYPTQAAFEAGHPPAP